jgi:hypothetical protein
MTDISLRMSWRHGLMLYFDCVLDASLDGDASVNGATSIRFVSPFGVSSRRQTWQR